jgi:hypothetical protein
MDKVRQNVRQLQPISLEALMKLGFRVSIVLAGFALLFVAAIYYGLINP